MTVILHRTLNRPASFKAEACIIGMRPGTSQIFLKGKFPMKPFMRLFLSTLTALAFTPYSAQAGIYITVTEIGGTGGSSSSNIAGNTGVFFGTVGDYKINVDVANTNYPGTTFGILTTTTNTQLVTAPASGPV